MLLVPRLFDKLLRRPRWPFPPAPSSEKIECDREDPTPFGEILAAAIYVDFGLLPFEFSQGYRNAHTADDQDCR
jgi:hypothetical protein